MKKFNIIVFAFLISHPGFTYTWNPIGTIQMNATKICFGLTFTDWVICANDGLYFYNFSTHETTFYTYSLPVTGAAYLNPDKILVTMGAGSYSDGIWTFDLQTHQFEVVEWMVYPNFLFFDDLAHTYWVGCQWGGLWKSQDGITWVEDPYFLAKPCGTMAGYGTHLVVTAIANLSNIYWSDDSGETWNASEIFPFISDMCFSPNGLLYGIFPDYSNSSGLWKSEDFGNTWETEFYSDNMSAVGFDCFGDAFVGWKENLGLAKYDPTAPPPGLTYLNSGLPNLNINKIQINPTMSAPALFICTDEGAYFSQDYMVGVEELSVKPGITVLPNPATDEVYIRSETFIQQIRILNESGRALLCAEVLQDHVKINTTGFRPGIYFIVITTEDRNITEKLVIL